jgi:hypothetical protein
MPPSVRHPRVSRGPYFDLSLHQLHLLKGLLNEGCVIAPGEGAGDTREMGSKLGFICK